MIEPLSPSERDALVASLDRWSYDPERNAFYRQLRFVDFAAALGAMVRIGVLAEKADHHPEWSNVYNRLEIWLTTHDANGVTMRDVKLAQQIDAVAADLGSE